MCYITLIVTLKVTPTATAVIAHISNPYSKARMCYFHPLRRLELHSEAARAIAAVLQRPRAE